MQARAFDYGVLAIGVVAVSTAAVLIKEASAPALVISAYRLTLASLPLLAYSALRRQPLLPSSRQRTLLTLLAGIFLALHFATWVASVQQTSIATSVFLVTCSPVFIALVSGPLLGERPTAAAWLGIGISGIGALIMVADDIGAGGDTLQGDLYALLGAIFAAGYLMVGRRLQADGSGLLAYITPANSVAAVILVALTLIEGDAFFGYSTKTYILMAGLALVPQLIGHTALIRSLAYLPAVAVSIAVLGEPVGAVLLGSIFLDETPTVLEIAGGAFVLAGVYVALRSPAVAARAEPQVL